MREGRVLSIQAGKGVIFRVLVVHATRTPIVIRVCRWCE